MSGKIFISYRREDSAGYAGRVHDRLAREFGRDLLFMDVDTIPLGVNFVKNLQEAVSECRVLLAIIGPNWIDARDEKNQRRLDNSHDFVRVEIATALQRDIPVVPILLGGSIVPAPAQLPADLRELSMRNGLEVRHASFHSDVDKLVQHLKSYLRSKKASSDEPILTKLFKKRFTISNGPSARRKTGVFRKSASGEMPVKTGQVSAGKRTVAIFVGIVLACIIFAAITVFIDEVVVGGHLGLARHF